ncbi:MAG: hypothetical protein GC157_13995 [Frankiales bacterium]|nr:hypothetical protein [Frankiales bacterium]
MSDWYQDNVVASGRSPALWMLLGFLVTYTVTRWVTLRIRARAAGPQPEPADGEGGGLIGDIHIGGVHVHHQVWGILLVLTTGLLSFRYSPQPPWQEVLAALFGVGAALALDEFALWLHLEDVYWTPEGRKSIDAVMIAVVVGILLLVGSAPLGIDSSTTNLGWVSVSVLVVVHVGYTLICLLKGKLVTGLVGLAMTILSLVGAIRLAKPDSFWARRFYSPAKMERASARFAGEAARRERWRARLGAGPPGSQTVG